MCPVALVDVRRLAAIDMHGVAGARLRRRLVLAEFSLGAGGAIALGLWAAIRAPGAGWRLFGAWIVGVGGSYVALALHGASLSRQAPWGRSWPASVSDPSLRRYTCLQVWVGVPLLLAGPGLRQIRHR